MNLTEQFLQFANVGAEWILWLLVLLSLASVALMVERALFYRSLSGKDAALLPKLHATLATKDFEQAKQVTQNATAPGGRMVNQMLANVHRGPKAMDAIVDALRPGERVRLDRNLNFLGTVGANAPFIGLLGTVLGIINTFRSIEQSGVQGSAEYTDAVMGGIYEALVATAVGLMVAIPAVIAYNYFLRRIKTLMSEADALTNMVHALLSNDK